MKILDFEMLMYMRQGYISPTFQARLDKIDDILRKYPEIHKKLKSRHKSPAKRIYGEIITMFLDYNTFENEVKRSDQSMENIVIQIADKL